MKIRYSETSTWTYSRLLDFAYERNYSQDAITWESSVSSALSREIIESIRGEKTCDKQATNKRQTGDPVNTRILQYCAMHRSKKLTNETPRHTCLNRLKAYINRLYNKKNKNNNNIRKK